MVKGTKLTNKGKNLKEAEFKIIRTLLDLKMKSAKIEEVSGRSYPTINRVSRCKTYAEYEALRDKESKRHAERLQELAKSTVAEPVEKTPQVVDLRSTASFNDELLQTFKRIAVAQEKLVDAWEAHPKAKRGFLS